MDFTDRRILQRIQKDFPLASRPYKVLGEELGLAEEEVFERIQALRKAGIIRSLGGVINAGSWGYVSTLVALKVPPERLKEVAGIINAHPGVTHNYLREGDYNLWFTLSCPSAAVLEQDLTALLNQSGVEAYMELPSQRVFKIKAVFSLDSSV